MTGAVLALTAVSKAFGGTPVLRGIDLSLAPGEIVALLGENGAGKSTLLNIVSGAVAPDEGELVFDGTPRTWVGPRQAIDAGIAFVHQELSAIGSLSVAENIFLGDYCSRHGLIDGRDMRRRARVLLDEVGASHLDPGSRMSDLRLADQQAVEIAKALRLDLKLLLLDEPTSSLTQHEAERLFSLVRRLAQRGVAVVFISHRIEEALALCGRIVVLRDGRLVSDRPRAETGRATILADMAGRTFSATRDKRAGRAGEVVMAAEGLADGGVVRDVSFVLQAGQVLGLFGLVGAGRTETLEMLFGARSISSGTVTLSGQRFAPRSPRAAIAAGLALVPEGRKANGILPNRPVAENIVVARVACASGPALPSTGMLKRLVMDAATRLGIVMTSPQQPIRTLSGGNQQKAILARCLALAPKVLLLDEPTHGVDVRTKAQIYDLIRQFAEEGGSVIISSSEMLELFEVADRILVLSGGRVTGAHDGRDADAGAIMRDAFLHAGG